MTQLGNRTDANIISLAEHVNVDHSLRLVENAVPSTTNSNVLCTLSGPFADGSKQTRNQRRYRTSLWKKVMAMPHVQEMLATKTFYGESDHPIDRYTIAIEHVSHVVTQLSLDEETGILYGQLDVLDTPAGRIVKTLVDYGSQLGISSRGAGKVIHEQGEYVVDDDSYIFVTFDIIPLPGNVVSRLTPTGQHDSVLNEGTSPVMPMIESFTTQVNKMIETGDVAELISTRRIFQSLNRPELQPLCEQLDHAIISTTDNPDKSTEDLREAYRLINQLKGQVRQLENEVRIKATPTVAELDTDRITQLLESNFLEIATKIDQRLDKVQEELNSASDNADEEEKVVIADLLNRIDELMQRNADLVTEINDLKRDYKAQGLELQECMTQLEDANSGLESSQTQVNRLMDKLSESDELIEELESKLEDKSNEMMELQSLNAELSESVDQLTSANEQLVKEKDQLTEELESSRTEVQTMKESLESTASSAASSGYRLENFIKSYIDLRASQLGINPKLIVAELPDDFSADDVDKVAKELAESTLHLSRLPSQPSTDQSQVPVIKLTEGARLGSHGSPKSPNHSQLVEIVRKTRSSVNNPK